MPVEVRVQARGSEGTVLSAQRDWPMRKAELGAPARLASAGLGLVAAKAWFRRWTGAGGERGELWACLWAASVQFQRSLRARALQPITRVLEWSRQVLTSPLKPPAAGTKALKFHSSSAAIAL